MTMTAIHDKLHLGCGPKHFKGWFHVDALEYPHVNHQGAVDNLSFIADNQTDLIYACHLLEHFGRHNYKDALREWYRVLKPGGILRLAVPDFEACAKLYTKGDLQNGISEILGLMVGGQKDKYDYHNMIFDRRSLTITLKEIGFCDIRDWNWRLTTHSHIDDFSQAYIPHMDKENGTLVSLNVEAIK